MTGPKHVSERQLAANRANALHSTGPQTPEGKAKRARNALKHGILSKAVIPPALEGYESHSKDLLLSVRCQTPPDRQIHRALSALGRLQRFRRGEFVPRAVRVEVAG